MKSKISINIDSDLLNIIRDCPDSDLDSIIQDALAQFFGVKQIWVRSDTLDPISNAPIQINAKIETPVKIDNEKMPIVKKRRHPKFVLKVWDKIKQDLGTEFTIHDYWDATKISGFNSRDIALYIKLIEEAGEIEKIGEKPKRYRKLENKELPGLKQQGSEQSEP